MNYAIEIAVDLVVLVFCLTMGAGIARIHHGKHSCEHTHVSAQAKQ